MPPDKRIPVKPDRTPAKDKQKLPEPGEHDEAMLDEAEVESFPASDPPASHRFDR